MKRRDCHELRIKLRGLKLRLLLHPEKMFTPNFVSLMAAHVMRVEPGDVFADICCGSGLHAITAALLGARRAYGTDTNPVALRFARLNARLNGVGGRCRFFRGDLLAPLKERGIRADCAVFSGPQCPEAYVDRSLSPELQSAVDGGGDGSGINIRFIRGVRGILAPGGRFYQPTAGWCGPSSSLKALRGEGFEWRDLVRTYVRPEGRGNDSRYFFLRGAGRRRTRLGSARADKGFTRILEAGTRLEEQVRGRPSDGMDIFVETELRAGRTGR